DEWVVRLFVQSEIDVRNVLLMLKGKAGNVSVDLVLERFIDGGSLPKAQAPDLYNARGVPELVSALEGRFPSLPLGLPAHRADGTLTGFETALVAERAVRELKRLRAYPLS